MSSIVVSRPRRHRKRCKIRFGIFSMVTVCGSIIKMMKKKVMIPIVPYGNPNLQHWRRGNQRKRLAWEGRNGESMTAATNCESYLSIYTGKTTIVIHNLWKTRSSARREALSYTTTTITDAKYGLCDTWRETKRTLYETNSTKYIVDACYSILML